MDDNIEQTAAAVATVAVNCTKPVQFAPAKKKYALQVILTSIVRPFFSAWKSLKKVECLCKRTPDEAFSQQYPKLWGKFGQIGQIIFGVFGVFYAKL